MKKEYKVWSVRLSDEMVEWLKEERLEHDSWNKLFIELKKKYETD